MAKPDIDPKWGPPGVHVGIVYETATGDIRRVMVPTFEVEISLHVLAPDESICLVPKARYDIANDLATLPQIQAIMRDVKASLP